MIKFKMFGFGSSKDVSPAPPPAESQIIASGSVDSLMPQQGKRVLIVDDDPVFLKATAMKLESSGFRVSTARESSEADAILMDINFPPDVCNGGMGSWDGFQLMTWLRGSPAAKGARFIMVSDSDLASDRERAQKLGAVAYLNKPVDPARLVATVSAEN
jgi:DNA-binding response OmpR family regulator